MPFRVGMSIGRSSTVKPRREPPRAANYHSVAVVAARDACSSARASKGKRVLANDAPILPLEGCDRPAHCSCRYQHFDDRRGQPRRQADGAPPPTANDVERRASVGRRAEDRLDSDIPETEAAEPEADTYYGFHRNS